MFVRMLLLCVLLTWSDCVCRCVCSLFWAASCPSLSQAVLRYSGSIHSKFWSICEIEALSLGGFKSLYHRSGESAPESTGIVKACLLPKVQMKPSSKQTHCAGVHRERFKLDPHAQITYIREQNETYCMLDVITGTNRLHLLCIRYFPTVQLSPNNSCCP